MERPAMRNALRLITFIVTAGTLSTAAQQNATQPVTSQQLLAGLKDPSAWLMFGGDYTDQRHSPLKAITPQNVENLRPEWMFQSQIAAPGRGFETTPLVVDGMMYI